MTHRLRLISLLTLLSLLILALCTLPARAEGEPVMTIVSRASDGTLGNDWSYLEAGRSLSGDGRFVAFYSKASNLVPGDENISHDVFVHDRRTGTTTLVSATPQGCAGNWSSEWPSISYDGRYVAFYSRSSDLVVDDANGYTYDIFVRDLAAGVTSLASISSTGEQGDGNSQSPSVSSDGRYVAFQSEAYNLVPDDTGTGYTQIYVRDRVAETTTIVSVHSDGTHANGRSYGPDISHDGRYVAYESYATNLVDGDTNGAADIFVHELATGETRRVSLSSTGAEANANSSTARISYDGHFVVFTSSASNLVTGDTNGVADVFLHDLVTQETQRVSLSSEGIEGDGQSTAPAISADGRYVSFMTMARNLVPGVVSTTYQVYLRDLQAGETRCISCTLEGLPGNGFSAAPALSGDGRVAAFHSLATNLVAGDTNATYDVFVSDRGVDQAGVLPLELDVPLSGALAPTPEQLYSLQLDAPGTALVVTITPGAGLEALRAMGRLGGLPTPGLYDAVAFGPNAREVYELVFEPAAAVEYLIALQAVDLSAPVGAYEIVARLVPRYLSSFEPRAAGNAGQATVQVTGAGLDRATAVRLEASGLPDLQAVTLGIVSPAALWTTFDLTGAAAGDYQLVVTFDDAQELRFDDVLTVSAGTGGELKARLITPWITRPDRRYTIWVEYENTGDADLPAPLFIVTAEPDLPLRLSDRDTASTGTVQLLGANPGSPASVLPPGGLGRIPLLMETSIEAESLYLNLGIVEDTGAPVDWEAYAESLRPARTSVDEWAALWPSLQPLLGDTWADYLQALRGAADRMQHRNVDPADVRQLLALLIAQAQGAPASSIAGLVLDAETLAPLPDVRVVARHQGEAAVRAEQSGADGSFAIGFLPGGTYDLYVEGYIVDPPPAVTISAADDAVGVRLLAAPIPPVEEPGPPLVQYADVQALDAAGTPHLLFGLNGQFYHTYHTGDAWAPAAPVPGAAGMEPRLVYAPNLLGGGPGLALFWRLPASLTEAGLPVPASIWAAAAQPDGAGGWIWSAPAVYNEHPVADSLGQVAVVDPAGAPLVVWQMQALADLDEDADLYYGHEAVAPLAASWAVTLEPAASPGATATPAADTPLLWTGSGQAVVLSADPQTWSEAFSMGFVFSQSGTVPRWVPYVGGKNEVTLSASLSGMASEGGATVSAGLGGELAMFDKKVTGSVSGAVGAGWMLDRQACAFNLSQATVSASMGATGRLPIPQLTYEDPFLQMYKTEVGLQVEASMGGTLTWTAQGYWPDGEVFGSAALGPYGKVAFGDLAEGAISGTGGLTLKMSAKGFEVSSLTFKASAEAQVGPFRYSTGWQYPPEVPVPPAATGTSLENAVYAALSEGMETTFTMTLVEKPGTAVDYGAPAVLAAVAADLVDDGRPALALAADGAAHLFWFRESDDLATTLGNTLTHATYNGSWDAPEPLAGTLGLSRAPAAALDAAGNLVVAWVHAGATGWDMDSDPKALHEARLAAVLRYGILQSDGTWVAPSALPVVPADHTGLVLRSLPSGDVWASWVTRLAGERSLYAARWDGATWSVPALVTTAPIEGAATLLTSNGDAALIWVQSNDNPELAFSQAAELFTASYTGAAWSTPAPLALTVQTDSALAAAMAADATAGVSAAASSLLRLNVAIPSSVCTPPDTPGDEPGQFNRDQEPASEPAPPGGVRRPVDRRLTYIFRPIDPNDKLGPEGYTEARTIDRAETLQYTIRFENVSTAMAPAQQVVVTDLLDADLDLASLRITEVAYGDRVIPVFDGRGGTTLHDEIVDYREGDDRTWVVYTHINLDYATGLMTAVLTTLDPDTGDYPEDPLAGFLPPNDEAGRGEGRISFEIDPRPGLPDGTTITNQARIVFDTEAPIDTAAWVNTIGTPYALAVDIVGQGFVDRDPFSALLFTGQAVTLSATPEPGWRFVGWGGDATGHANPLVVTITGDTLVTAIFAEQMRLYLPLVAR
ncbi:MAG: hypothetical protein R6X16_07810 [Anaerolineae bacterium]